MLRKANLQVVVLSVLVLCVCAQDPESISQRPLCLRGEAYTICGSTCTEPKCKPDKPMICPEVCYMGCFCRNGFARNRNGVCVPRFMCAYANYEG
uniref:TIL domain-containing protein n=1 Tax=Anopheles funestus TaxID=62324 RepID=A0A4Y0BGJ3_ANOFN